MTFKNHENCFKTELFSNVDLNRAEFRFSPGNTTTVAHDVSQIVLDLIHFGVICVDSDMRVLFMNRFAHLLIAKRDGIFIDGSRLIAGFSQTVDLRRLLAELGTSFARKRHIDHRIIKLQRASTGRPFEVFVRPLPVEVEGNPAIAFLLLVFDPEHMIELNATAVAHLYRLTPAEIRVAFMLARGKTLAEAATALERTRETLRKQLQIIFSKTETKRQSELVSLLLRSPAVYRFRD
jgi:DNA-binding CsgD family transcriptional regulator